MRFNSKLEQSDARKVKFGKGAYFFQCLYTPFWLGTVFDQRKFSTLKPPLRTLG